jgi:hypothetical protein
MLGRLYDLRTAATDVVVYKRAWVRPARLRSGGACGHVSSDRGPPVARGALAGAASGQSHRQRATFSGHGLDQANDLLKMGRL